MADRQGDEQQLKSALAGLKNSETDGRLLSAQRIFRTRQQSLFSVRYAETCQTSRIAEISSFELRYRQRKYLSRIQKALRHDLPNG